MHVVRRLGLGYDDPMRRSDRNLIAIALAPNLVLILGLFGLMAWRMASRLSPLPDHSAGIVMALCAGAPLASVAFATVLRSRRNAKGT
jgi:hypothetical protein